MANMASQTNASTRIYELKRAKLEYFVSKDIIGYRFGEVRLGYNGYM